MMKKKTLFIIGGLIILLVIIFLVSQFKKTNFSVNNQNLQTKEKTSEVGNLTKFNTPSDVRVLDVNDEPKGDEAAPYKVDVENGRKVRYFKAKIENGQLTPAEFILYEGEEIELTIAAIDNDYVVIQPDVGLKTTIKKDREVNIRYLMSISGKYLISAELTNGSKTDIKGYITVVPKPSK